MRLIMIYVLYSKFMLEFIGMCSYSLMWSFCLYIIGMILNDAYLRGNASSGSFDYIQADVIVGVLSCIYHLSFFLEGKVHSC